MCLFWFSKYCFIIIFWLIKYLINVFVLSVGQSFDHLLVNLSIYLFLLSKSINKLKFLRVCFLFIWIIIYILEASYGVGAQSVTVNAIGCGFDSHSSKWYIYLNSYFHFFVLVSRQSAALIRYSTRNG